MKIIVVLLLAALFGFFYIDSKYNPLYIILFGSAVAGLTLISKLLNKNNHEKFN